MSEENLQTLSKQQLVKLAKELKKRQKQAQKREEQKKNKCLESLNKIGSNFNKMVEDAQQFGYESLISISDYIPNDNLRTESQSWFKKVWEKYKGLAKWKKWIIRMFVTAVICIIISQLICYFGAQFVSGINVVSKLASFLQVGVTWIIRGAFGIISTVCGSVLHFFQEYIL